MRSPLAINLFRIDNTPGGETDEVPAIRVSMEKRRDGQSYPGPPLSFFKKMASTTNGNIVHFLDDFLESNPTLS